jgi:PAS domain S-box-containing protein
MVDNPRRQWVPYAVAVAAVAAAVAIQLALDPLLGGRIPFATLFLAVLLVAAQGGFRPAIFAAVLGGFAAAWFLLAPRYSFVVAGIDNQFGLVLYAVVAFTIAAAGGAMHQAQKRGASLADQLSVQHELLRTTLASIGDGVITTDLNGRVTFLNPAAEQITGWQLSQAAGRPLEIVFPIVNETTAEPVENPAYRALREGVIVGLANHTALIAKDGTRRPIADSAAPIRHADGRTSGSVLVFRDVSQQRRAERDQAWLAAVVESSDDAIITKTLDGVISSWNAGAERVFGYTAEEAIGKPITLVIPPERIEEEREILARLRRGERVAHFDTERIAKDGRRLDISLSISPIRDKAGDIIGASKVARDMTARRAAERAAQSAESMLSLITNSLPALISYIDKDYCYRLNNRAYEEWFNQPRESIYGKHVRDVLGERAWNRLHGWMESALAGNPVRYEDFVDYGQAGARWIEAVYTPHVGHGGSVEGFAVLVNDISERKAAEAALLESEQRFHHMADHSPVMIWLTDVEGKCTFLSKSWYEFTGQSAEFALRHGWLDAIHPEDRTIASQRFAATKKRNEAFRTEYRLRRADGEYRWMLDSAVRRVSEDGREVGCIGSIIDITDRKNAEDSLRAADRRKDEFLAMLAHELRNPLAPVRSALDVMMRSPDQELIGQARQTMHRQLRNLERLVDDLLDISRITQDKLELRRQRVELAPLVQQAVEACRPLADAAGHRLSIDLPPEPIPLDADSVRLTQVFSNLLNNACKYTPPGGTIAIAALRDGNETIVTVKDSGIGIAPDVLPRIFDMFAQAAPGGHAAQSGLGIGLTLVRRLVEMHGGQIEGKSEGLGRGSEFVVRLPLAMSDVQPAANTVGGDHPELPKNGRRILVVDDNRDAARTLAMLLKLSGHETHLAYDGEEAVEASARLQPDIVLLDIGLPKLSGHEVARRIRRQPHGSTMMLVALTGWGQEEDRRKSSEAGFDHHLVKPVNVEALTRLLGDEAAN